MSRDRQLRTIQSYLNSEQLKDHTRTCGCRRADEPASPATAEHHDSSTNMREEASASPPSAIRKILVAVDESAPAKAALAQAVQLAGVLGARVSVVHVLEPVAMNLEPTITNLEGPILTKWGKGVLRRAMHQVPVAVRGDSILQVGSPADQILAAAEENQADLLVMGRQGKRLLERWFLGSTAKAVLRKAKCPVLTVSRSTQSDKPCNSCKESPSKALQAN